MLCARQPIGQFAAQSGLHRNVVASTPGPYMLGVRVCDPQTAQQLTGERQTMPHPNWMTKRHIVSELIRLLMSQGLPHNQALAKALEQQKHTRLTEEKKNANVNLRSAPMSD